MTTHTDDLPPDRVLVPHWRAREISLQACGLPEMGRGSARNALASLVANAGLAAETDQEWVSYSRRRRWYAARSECGDLTYDNVVHGMAIGVEAGLFEEDRALPGSHLDPVPRQSRYRATPLLIERLGKSRFEHVRPASSILLRDADGRPVDYAITDRVGRLRRAMDARNEWTSGFRVEVSPKADPADWRRSTHHLHARKVRDGRETWTCALPDPGNRLVRIYGRGRFDQGGRAYGWWQNLPGDRRAELMLNGEFTFEPDFPTLHPRFAYAMVGAEMPEDVYQTPQGHDRKHGKLALNVLINCQGGLRGAVDALMWRPDWTGSRGYTQGLVQAVADHNAPIASLLGSDAGIGFMNIDSGMAMEVMDRCRREDIPCLPVHDSFRVATKSANHVTAIMGEVLDATLARISPASTTSSSARLKRAPVREISDIIPQVPRSGAAAPAASPLPASSAPAPAEKASSKKTSGKADFRPVQTVKAEPAPEVLPTPSEPLAADWDLSERTEALAAHFERKHHAELAFARAFHGLKLDLRPSKASRARAREEAEEMARREWDEGRRLVDGVPDRLSDREKAKRARAAAPKASRPRRPMRTFPNLRPSTRWAKPQETPPKVEAKPQGTLF